MISVFILKNREFHRNYYCIQTAGSNGRAGLVAKYTVDGTSSACFEYLGHEEHCHKHVCFHCKCEKCGKVIHLECDEMTHLGKHMLDDHGFQWDFTRHCILRGSASNSKKKNKEV